MRSTVSIIQPSLLPWIGYFAMIKQSSHFVYYDNVQFDKHGWRNRNRVVHNNELKWITIPILTKNRFGQLINEAPIDYTQNWKRKILGQIQQCYSRSEHFEEHFSWLQSRLDQNYELLCDLSIQLTEDVCNFLEIENSRILASSLNLTEEDKVLKIISIMKILGGNHYLSGPSAQAYIHNPELFTNAGIDLEFFHYLQKPYSQGEKAKDFVPYASILDLLFHHGKAAKDFI